VFFPLGSRAVVQEQEEQGRQERKRGESISKTIARRVKIAWEGRWKELWEESSQAVWEEGAQKARREQDLALEDIKTIEEAYADGDEKGALRKLSQRIDLAPEAKARAVLPGLFPRAQKPIPQVAMDELQSLIKGEDVEAFHRHLAAAFQYAPPRRGAGWGGSIAELWSWAPTYEEEWAPVRRFLTQLALATDVARETYAAFTSARVLASDRPEENKVRPLGLGNLFRRCINGAKARVFKGRAIAATMPYQYAIGGTQSAETMHKTTLVDLDTRPGAGLH